MVGISWITTSNRERVDIYGVEWHKRIVLADGNRMDEFDTVE